MIELATRLTAGRVSYRPAGTDDKGADHETPRMRSGHPWPFLSRFAARPVQHEESRSAANGSGS